MCKFMTGKNIIVIYTAIHSDLARMLGQQSFMISNIQLHNFARNRSMI